MLCKDPKAGCLPVFPGFGGFVFQGLGSGFSYTVLYFQSVTLFLPLLQPQNLHETGNSNTAYLGNDSRPAPLPTAFATKPDKSYCMGLKLKKIPKKVQEAQGRFVGMQKIDADQGSVVEYGSATDSVTSVTASAKNKAYVEFVDSYNRKKKDLDGMRNELATLETELVAMGNRVLAGARSKFGFDSPQVETLGGTRTSERKPARAKRTSIALNPEIARTA